MKWLPVRIQIIYISAREGRPPEKDPAPTTQKPPFLVAFFQAESRSAWKCLGVGCGFRDPKPPTPSGCRWCFSFFGAPFWGGGGGWIPLGCKREVHQIESESLKPPKPQTTTPIFVAILPGGFKYFYFHPYLGKIPILTNIFQRGWNHQPALVDWSWFFSTWKSPTSLVPYFFGIGQELLVFRDKKLPSKMGQKLAASRYELY